MPDHLFHFSEDPTIDRFVPRVAPTQQIEGAFVWADDEEHCYRYWFPRDCPRGTWWEKSDREKRVAAIQWDWLNRFRACELYVYTFDGGTFRENPLGGGWISEETITPIDVQPVGPLLDKHRDAGVEFRIVSDLKRVWADVIERTDIDFSGIRLRNLDAQ